MVQGNEGEGAESPEDEGVGQAGKRALADHFGLAEDFPEEIPDALADGEEMEGGVFLRLQDFVQDNAETTPEEVGGGDDQGGD